MQHLQICKKLYYNIILCNNVTLTANLLGKILCGTVKAVRIRVINYRVMLHK